MFKKAGKTLFPTGIILLLLLFWEIIIKLKQIPLYILPAPTKILSTFVREFSVLAEHSMTTLMEAFWGIGIALLAGIILGILMDSFSLLKRCLYPILVVTQTIPVIVLAPIFIIYLGFGLAPKILTVVLMCFFPIVVNFSDGMTAVDVNYINLVRSYGAKHYQIYTIVKLPAAMTSLLSGLRVAATYSISGAVVGEWIASQKGLGYYMLKVKNGYMLDKVFACVIMIVLLSLFMNAIVSFLQHFMFPYTKRLQRKIQAIPTLCKIIEHA